jgi:hypothetical protein
MIEACQPLTSEWWPFGYYPLSNIHWRVIRVGETGPRGYNFELWVFSYVGDWDMSASISSLVSPCFLLLIRSPRHPVGGVGQLYHGLDGGQCGGRDGLHYATYYIHCYFIMFTRETIHEKWRICHRHATQDPQVFLLRARVQSRSTKYNRIR